MPVRTQDYTTLAHVLIERLRGKLTQMEFDLLEHDDFESWKAELARAPATLMVNPAFDPAYCDLSRARVLQLRAGDDTVGVIAGKAIDGDFVELMRSGALWYGREAGAAQQVAVSAPPEVPALAGRLAYFGGLWLHPRVRGTGLSSLLPRLIRAIAVRDWLPDFLCGGVLEALAIREIPTRVYGYAHCVQIGQAVHFPLTGKKENLFMPWESLTEWLALSQVYLAALSLDEIEARVDPSHQDTIGARTVVAERQKQSMA